MNSVGRPIIDDTSMLERMADMIFGNPILVPTEAFRCCYEWRPWHQSELAERKRLVRKFQNARGWLMEAAETRFYRQSNLRGRPSIIIPRLIVSRELQASINGFIKWHKPPALIEVGAVAKRLELSNQKMAGDMMRVLKPMRESHMRIGKVIEAYKKSMPRLQIKPYQLPKGLSVAIRMQNRLPRVVVRDIQL